MRTVLYTEDLQPIAIVELTPNEEDIITHGGVLRLAYISPMKIAPLTEYSFVPSIPTDIKIYGEMFQQQLPARSAAAPSVQLILFTRSNLLKPQPALSLSELSL